MGYEILKDNHQKLYIESAKAEKYIETDFETSIEKVNKILEVLRLSRIRYIKLNCM